MGDKRLLRLTLEVVAEEEELELLEEAVSETLWYAMPDYQNIKWDYYEILDGTEDNPIIKGALV